MKKSILRTSFIVVLVLALVGLTISSFAYWDQLTKTTDDQTVEIGVGTETILEINTNTSDKVLVPAGVVMDSNDIDEIKYTYTVKLDKNSVEDLYLITEIKDLKIDGDSTYSNLVNVAITNDNEGKVNSGGTKVTLKITLTEPANVTEYDAIAGKNITFKLKVTASQTEPSTP